MLGGCVGLLCVYVRLCRSFVLGSYLLVLLQAYLTGFCVSAGVIATSKGRHLLSDVVGLVAWFAYRVSVIGRVTVGCVLFYLG